MQSQEEVVFLLFSCLVMSDSLQPHRLQHARLLCPWDFSGKNIGVGHHFLLQRIFPTQGLNSDLLHCRWILYHSVTWETQTQYCGIYSYQLNAMHKDQIDSQIEITFQLIIYQISTWNISELCGFLSCRYTEKMERPLDPEHAITFNIFKKSGHTHQGNQIWERHVHPNVHRSTVCHSQDMEAT